MDVMAGSHLIKDKNTRNLVGWLGVTLGTVGFIIGILSFVY